MEICYCAIIQLTENMDIIYMRKFLTGLICLLTISTCYGDTYPTCRSRVAVQDLGYIYHKIVLCPHGFIIASVRPKINYHNYVIAYDNYCRDIKLTFSTKSANVLINNYQYYQTSGVLAGHKQKGLMQIPNIETGFNSGIVKITNDSDTSVCLGQQCLYQ